MRPQPVKHHIFTHFSAGFSRTLLTIYPVYCKIVLLDKLYLNEADCLVLHTHHDIKTDLNPKTGQGLFFYATINLFFYQVPFITGQKGHNMFYSNTFDFSPEWEMTFRDEETLLAAVRNTEAQSYWTEISNKHTRFAGPDEAPDNAIKQYLRESGRSLYMAVGQDNVPISPTALEMLKIRCGFVGPGLNKGTDQELAILFNLWMKYIKEPTTTLLIRRGLIYGFYSGKYLKMPAETVIKSARRAAEDRFGRTRLTHGYHSNLLTIASYELPDYADQLVDAYQDAIENSGGGESAEVMPMISVITSDTGTHTASIRPCFKDGRREIYFGGDVSIKHDARYGTGLMDFTEEATKIFARFDEIPKTIKKLADHVIAYPRECMTNVIRKLNGSGSSLPLSLSRIAVENCDIHARSCGSISAYTVYLFLSEIPSMAKDSSRYPFSSITRMEETVARALKLNWDEFDTPYCTSI